MIWARFELWCPDPLVDAEKALPVHVGSLVNAAQVPNKILRLVSQEPWNKFVLEM
jgi:hypothetical protein